jgi:hypothetical protein
MHYQSRAIYLNIPVLYVMGRPDMTGSEFDLSALVFTLKKLSLYKITRMKSEFRIRSI